MKIQTYGKTDVGKRRKNNQDSIYFSDFEGLAIVADGMGGHQGGEIASSLAVKRVRMNLNRSKADSDTKIDVQLRDIVLKTNQDILEQANSRPELKGMGTTLECLIFNNEELHIAHVGDSRTYLFRDDSLYCLTIDHNVKTFKKRGWLNSFNTPLNASDEMLMRAIGLGNKLEIEIYHRHLNVGDIFLVASDGLFNMISSKQILNEIKQHKNKLENLPHVLVSHANMQGGKDNISVVICQVIAGEDEKIVA